MLLNGRLTKYRKGPETFRSLREDVHRLADNIEDVDKLRESLPSGMPAEISVPFNEALSAARKTLESALKTIKESLVKAFPENSLDGKVKLKSRVHRTCRATALESTMSFVEAKVLMSLNQILHLKLNLVATLQLQEHQDAVLLKLIDLSVVETSKDEYRSASNIPTPSSAVNLDFEGKDASGMPATPEGTLKQLVMSSDSLGAITAAAGAMSDAYGVVGMAGVGKTVALQGLAYDKDVRQRFRDGIFYMCFGQGATPRTFIREIMKIMAISGASAKVQSVISSTSVRQAVDFAVEWFQGKICLFLVDDLWPTESSPLGFFLDLRQLLRASPGARMAISTRSVAIAVAAGRVVSFNTRNPLGAVSEKIFMSHATRGLAGESYADHGRERRRSVSKILSICGGLPIALSVTGCAVSFLATIHRDFERACDAYAVQLEKKMIDLGDECTVEGASLNAGILLSLDFLEVEFLNWRRKASVCTEHTITDLYTSLCVLQDQAWIPLSVLCRLWQHDRDATMHIVNLFCGLSLASLSFRRPTTGSPEEVGITLHDMALNFCKRQAERMTSQSMWHARVLNGYLEASEKPADKDPSIPAILAVTSFAPRPWWSAFVPDDGYIHANLARHLFLSGQAVELAALLLDARWTILRAKVGGILALKTDFEVLEWCFAQWESSREQEARVGEVRQSFGLVFKATQLSWGRISEGLRAFQFQVCGRLLRLRRSNEIVHAYLNSVEMHTPKPYLRPMSSFFPELNSAQIMEIPVGGRCKSMACSLCGRYIAVGVKNDIVVAETSTGDILQRLTGHIEIVMCITFVDDARRIVSGSADRTLMVWEWEISALPMLVLDGHRDNVTGVAVSSDGEQIFSTSRDRTLKIWSATTGTQRAELPQSSPVNCVAICGEGRKIALGLDNGTLKVLDRMTKEVLFEDTEAHEEHISSVSFSPHGLCLATGSWDKTVKVWSPRTWTRIGEHFEGHEDRVTSVAFSADGKQVASSSHDGTIRHWNIESRQCFGVSLKLSSPAESVLFSADGERIISGSHDGVVRVWDALRVMQTKEESYGHAGLVHAVSISQDGLRVASASHDGTGRFWDSRAGEQIGTPLEGHKGAVFCVSFSPDGRQVVSGSADRTLRLWDTARFTQIGDQCEGHTDSVSCVSFSSDGLRISSGSSDRTVRLWNTQTHEQIGGPLLGHTHEVSCVSESADGCCIVSRDISGITIIWNRESGLIVWKSEKIENASEGGITDDQAELIIRSCGQEIPHLWPSFFPPYAAELFCENLSVFSNLLGEKTFLADLAPFEEWKYIAEWEVFAAGLRSGAVTICKLIKADNDGVTGATSVTGAVKPASGLLGMAVEKTVTVQGTSRGKQVGAGSSSNREGGFSNGNIIASIELVELLSLNDDLRSKRIASILEDKLMPGETLAWGRAVKFSSRFSAVWGDLEDRTGTVWFCNVDGEHSAFVLKSDSSVEEGEATSLLVRSGENSESIRCLCLPAGETSWSTLLQSAADFMESDNEIRAVQMACLICAHVEGGKSCVSDALIPRTLRTLSTRVIYDIPIDVDLMTTLADALNIEHQLYFRCGLGTLAKVAGEEKGVCHLHRIENPAEFLRHLGSTQALPILPILYGDGYGRFLNTEVPCTTKQIGEIVPDLPKQGSIFPLLWAISKSAPELQKDGLLNLQAAAGVIFESKGAFLGTGTTRKIRGDVLLVGRDGIYRSSRCRGVQVEGSFTVHLAIVKLGMRIVKEADPSQDKRIDNLREIAEYILGREYKMQYHVDHTQDMVFGPDDLWSKETAVCNTLVGLLCRKYGLFTGFSKVVCTEQNVKRHQTGTMEADIFLPALSVWPSGYCRERSNWQNWSDEVRRILIQRREVLVYAGPTIGCESDRVSDTIEIASDTIEIASDIWKGRPDVDEDREPINAVLASRPLPTRRVRVFRFMKAACYWFIAHRDVKASVTVPEEIPRSRLTLHQNANDRSIP